MSLSNVTISAKVKRVFSYKNALLQGLMYDIFFHCSLLPVIVVGAWQKAEFWGAVMGHSIMFVFYMFCCYVVMRRSISLGRKLAIIAAILVFTFCPISLLINYLQEELIVMPVNFFSTMAMCFVITIICALTCVIKHIQLQQQNQEKEMILLSEENLHNRYEALKQQLSPHFIFNTFNTIEGLVASNSPEAQKSINQLSNMLRYTIDSREEVTLAEEMSFVQSYLFLQKLRFGNLLIIDIDYDKRYDAFIVPPISVQLLVENAVKHNIISKKHPLTIHIGTTDNGWLVVQNAICARIEKESAGGIGLQNLKERYRLLYRKEIEIDNDGKQFTVKIPLIQR